MTAEIVRIATASLGVLSISFALTLLVYRAHISIPPTQRWADSTGDCDLSVEQTICYLNGYLNREEGCSVSISISAEREYIVIEMANRDGKIFGRDFIPVMAITEVKLGRLSDTGTVTIPLIYAAGCVIRKQLLEYYDLELFTDVEAIFIDPSLRKEEELCGRIAGALSHLATLLKAEYSLTHPQPAEDGGSHKHCA